MKDKIKQINIFGSNKINSSKYVITKQRKQGFIVGFITGIITSLIASIIYETLIKPLLLLNFTISLSLWFYDIVAYTAPYFTTPILSFKH